MSVSKIIIFSVLTVVIFLINNPASAQKLKSKKDKVDKNLVLYEKYIDDNADAHLKEYAELVNIPGISSVPSRKADVARSADWIVNKLKSIGFPVARTIPTEFNPVVFGSWDKAPGKPTVLIYAHYDVQPVKDSEWTNPPFQMTTKDGRIFGRGTSDDKSGILITMWAAEAMLAVNKTLPVNLKFVFEGDEEVGSPGFSKFINENKELLKADFAVDADGGQFDDSTGALFMGLRGAVQLEVDVKTANIDAHSGVFGGKTPNADVALAQIISSFYNKDGSVAVDGFYDKVIPLTDEEKEMIKKVPYDPKNDMKSLGTTAETGDMKYSPLERVWYRPTLEIVGMQGGYTAKEGFSNIVPGNAMARITCRLVSNQSGKEINDLIIKHIGRNTPAGATVTYKIPSGNGVGAFKFPAHTTAYNYVSDALTKIYGKQPLQVATGGTGGALMELKEVLGIYPYSLGFQLDDERAHGANEFFRLSSIRRGQLVYCYYLQHLAESEAKAKK